MAAAIEDLDMLSKDIITNIIALKVRPPTTTAIP
jgi:hypothetical protein